ncbi:Nif3-like dinuclear metal center hexameric protein [Cytophagaceae bacterium ABcell3]|nr:Nif3-like dinuclear metal center hexameric protein [Cytophagaceae bacterium ABcell3]
MTKISEVVNYLESIAPTALQESYDNSGLLTGNSSTEVKNILITLDTTEDVIKEAIANNCNLIISHHPIIFKGLKKLTGSNYVERTIIEAIKNDIAIYAVHTNLDNVHNGVNRKICEKIELKNLKILSPKKGTLKKLVVFIPESDKDIVLSAVYNAGAGNIGNYSECSYQLQGTGTFRPNDQANPTIGAANTKEQVKEVRAEVIYPAWKENGILQALKEAHPYEEPAYDLVALENTDFYNGSGMYGELENPLPPQAFLKYLKEKMQLSCIRHTQLPEKPVKKVAVCGGSGSFLLKNAIKQKADVYITSDFKYHEFFDAENKIIIADIGHYESEVFTKELIKEFMSKKFTNIALILSNTTTNPISYY